MNDGSGHEPGRRKMRRIDPFSATIEDESSQCANCAALKKADLFDVLEKEGMMARITNLGTLESLESQSCPCCRFLASFNLPEDRELPQKPLSLYLHSPRPSRIWGLKGSVLTVAPQDLDDRDVEKTLDYRVKTAGAIACTGSDAPPCSLMARRIRHDSIKFGLIRHWIGSCLKYHEKCNWYAARAATPVGMKLIDCETRQIVPAESYEYVALSYVWGLDTLGPAFDDTPRNGRLPEMLLQTIDDAILATKKLGYRYIWIDRYCIDQENIEEKKGQIRQMNTIYRNAAITIVATAGKNPRFGLPGVSTTLRNTQASARIEGTEFVSIFPHPKVAIDKSKWKERGWTYQEGYFSIRQLIFLEDQVYFWCYSGEACETICHLDEVGEPYAVEAKNDGEQEAFRILEHLENYSGRQLSHGTDAINAVAGVFNDNGFKWGTTPHHFGVPIVRFSQFNKFRPEGQRRRATDGFLMGLCWQNRKPLKRRNLWPSWTWAEWIGQFDYGVRGDHPNADSFTLSTDFVIRPKAFIEARNGSLLDFQETHTLDILQRRPEALGNFIRIETWVLALNIHLQGAEGQHSLANVTPLRPIRSHDEGDETVERYYATLKDKDVDIKIRLWPMHPSYGNADGLSRFAPDMTPDGGGGDVFALLLAKHQLSGGRFGHDMMIVQDKGAHYERIGHCIITPEQIWYLANCSGPVEDDWEFGWTRFHETTKRLCDEFYQRKMLRIG